MNHFDVIIVGLGPTGSITALLLESYGIKVLGIEKEKEVYNLPRAVTRRVWLVLSFVQK